MEVHNLSFVRCIILREDIAEIIVNEAVEVNLDMVDEVHEFLISNLKAPFSVLVNKINRYTYSFEAQLKVGSIKEINAQALLIHNKTTEVTTKYFAELPREIPWKYRVFSDRIEAFDWLISEQDVFQV